MDTIELLKPYTNQHVRDLIWALYSPSLISFSSDNLTAFTPPPYENDIHWFMYLDSKPQEIESYIKNKKAVKLGSYFENLLSFYFEHHERYQLCGTNLQLIHEKETLGEFDFIIYDTEMKYYIHLESTVKYYMEIDDYTEGEKSQTQWYGPDLRDRLSIKCSHLLEKQCLLSENPHSVQFLNSKIGTINQPLQKQYLCKGYVFHNINTQGSSFLYCNNHRLLGRWIRFTEIKKQNILDNGCLWSLSERLERLSPLRISLKEDKRLLSQKALIKHLEKMDSPFFLYMMEKNKKAWIGKELLCAVPNNWFQRIPTK